MVPLETNQPQKVTQVVPDISLDELNAFHQSHFGQDATQHFSNDFMTPSQTTGQQFENNDEEYYDEYDDLGYYDDGVKRTLTDEQIEIFRHSELRELEKAKEKASKSRDSKDESNTPDASDTLQEPPVMTKSRTKKQSRGKGNKQTRREPKPDLRKRTWDVVEAGLDSLDYD